MPQQNAISLKKSEKKRLIDVLNRFHQAKVLVIGDFILDQFVWGDVRRISPEAPVPVVDVRRESYMPGGSLNVANNIRHLSGVVYPCGVLGRDLEGRALLKVMRGEGIETGGITYDRNRPTSVKTRIIAHSQQVVRFDREKTGDIPAEDRSQMMRFIQQRLPLVDVVIIEDYGKGVIQPALLKKVVSLANRHKKPVLVDPKEEHFSYYAGVSVITPNRAEAFAAVRQATLEASQWSVQQVGAWLLKKLKLQAVLMTLGEDGMALFEKKGRVTKIPTSAREVYDVSGAGDTVIAVFGLALASGADMRLAALLANIAAGIVIGKLGTATISREELKNAVEGIES